MTQVAAAAPDRRPAWRQCAACGVLLYEKALARKLRVCPECGYHHRLTARERIDQLFDKGWVLIETRVESADVLGFVDSKPYPVRLADARSGTGLDEAVVLARGEIGGAPVVAAVMDFRFLGGSLGAAVGELITLAAELALARGVPLLIVSASGGARMQESGIALMQMVKTSAALGRLDDAGVFTVSLITDPTYGGVAASYASLCDVIVAEPGARFGFAGPRVIRQTLGEELPSGFQTAEFMLGHGLVDLVRPRAELPATLGRLLATGRGVGSPVRAESGPAVVRDHRQLAEPDPWTVVRSARAVDRPTTLEYLAMAFDEFDELRGDRVGGDCTAIVGGLARLSGAPVVVIGQQKGHTAAELAQRNFGMPRPAGYRKAARLMRMAEKLGLPVVTLVDTPGAFPGVLAEEQGQAGAIAENIRLMAGLRVPIVTVITGEGGSGGALALAVADEVLICSNGSYSVISPEGCAAILWKNAHEAPAAAGALCLDARNLLRLGIVDGVVVEPQGGTQADHRGAAHRLRTALLSVLPALSTMDAAVLVDRRRQRFRAYGVGGTRLGGSER